MTAPRPHALTRTAIAVAAAIAMLAVTIAAAPPAHAATLDKVDVVKHLFWRADIVITENNIATNKGASCASDIGRYSTKTRKQICKMKDMGVWSGSRFHGGQAVDRGRMARYLMKTTRWLNAHKRQHMNQALTTSAAYVGFCSSYYDDCGQAANGAELGGIAFVSYWGMDDGYSSARQYDPNVYVNTGDNNSSRAWRNRVWWSDTLD